MKPKPCLGQEIPKILIPSLGQISLAIQAFYLFFLIGGNNLKIQQVSFLPASTPGLWGPLRPQPGSRGRARVGGQGAKPLGAPEF